MKTRLLQWLVSFAILSIFGAAVCLPGTALAATTPQGILCTPGLEYQIYSYIKQDEHQTEPTAVYDNDTGQTQSVTFTSQYARSRSFSVDVSFSVDTSVIFESVHVTVGVSATFSETTTIGFIVPVKGIANGKTAEGFYGVFGAYTSGDYYYLQSNCQKGHDYGTVDAWSPWGFGWETKIVNG